MFFSPLLEGFALGLSLIVAIGAQNAFVLKQGLKKHHLFLTAATCFVCDSILIILGVKGIGILLADLPFFTQILRWGGALFLTYYAFCSFRNVLHPHVLTAKLKDPIKKKKLATFLALLGFTFLNPHTYIDTMLLLGSVGAERPSSEHTPFIIGTLIASFVWFFGLTYGAGRLNPVFQNPRAWQILDSIIGCVMIGIAISLIIP